MKMEDYTSMLDDDIEGEDASPSMLTAATLFMMTRFVERPSADSAVEVLRHLEIVAEDERGDPLMREMCAALAQRWQGHLSNLCSRHSAGFDFNPGSMTHH